jgi:enolase-phosphatase E1
VSTTEAPQVRAILLDIEGTTTPVEFVYQTLFPFASRKLESFLQEHAQDAEIQKMMEELHAQHELDARSGMQPPGWVEEPEEAWLRAIAAYGRWLIAKDSKCTPLKSLEGKIWQQGYTSGELRGEVFPDVTAAFERWRRQKKIICIYSSGSVLAQQLLFRTTPSGDLTPYISLYFDTRVGAKTEAESYQRIADSFAYRPEQFLFISDAVKEIEAARSAGMQALLCVRANDTASLAGASGVIQNFNGIFPD